MTARREVTDAKNETALFIHGRFAGGRSKLEPATDQQRRIAALAPNTRRVYRTAWQHWGRCSAACAQVARPRKRLRLETHVSGIFFAEAVEREDGGSGIASSAPTSGARRAASPHAWWLVAGRGLVPPWEG